MARALNVRTILSALGLRGGGGGVAGAGGILPIRNGAWVDPSNPFAVDDTDLSTPFVTIQAAIDVLEATAQALSAGFPPYVTAAQMLWWTVYTVPGIFDEDVAFPGGLAWRWVMLGPVTLGNGTQSNLGSTNTRNVTWDTNPQIEPSFTGQDQIRPGLCIETLTPGPTSSTHTGYACGLDITGNLELTDTSGLGGSTVELHLCQVKIRGDLVHNKPGITNIYAENCFFDQAITNPFPGSPNLVVIKETEFDGTVTIASLSRAVQCEIQGDWTVSGVASYVPPNGFIDCQFGPGITWTGPAGSFIVDAYSNAKAKAAGVALGGGATKVIIGDTTP